MADSEFGTVPWPLIVRMFYPYVRGLVSMWSRHPPGPNYVYSSSKPVHPSLLRLGLALLSKEPPAQN
jgi:hypothetical protein